VANKFRGNVEPICFPYITYFLPWAHNAIELLEIYPDPHDSSDPNFREIGQGVSEQALLSFCLIEKPEWEIKYILYRQRLPWVSVCAVCLREGLMDAGRSFYCKGCSEKCVSKALIFMEALEQKKIDAAKEQDKRKKDRAKARKTFGGKKKKTKTENENQFILDEATFFRNCEDDPYIKNRDQAANHFEALEMTSENEGPRNKKQAKKSRK
jgi:hypothetical protein